MQSSAFSCISALPPNAKKSSDTMQPVNCFLCFFVVCYSYSTERRENIRFLHRLYAQPGTMLPEKGWDAAVPRNAPLAVNHLTQKVEEKTMKKWIALLLAAIMALSLCACGGKNDNGAANGEGSGLTAEQQLIVDAVRTEVQSEKFAAWQALYKEDMGSDPKAPEVTTVLHYEIADFEGEKMDGYLVNISAGVRHGAPDGNTYTDSRYGLFVSSDGKTVIDSITVDAPSFDGDTSTPEGRATYLLWIFGGIIDDSYHGNFLNDAETVTEWSADELAIINSNM